MEDIFMLKTVRIQVLQLAHSIFEKNLREIIFEVTSEDSSFQSTGLKYDLSKKEDLERFQKMAWLADVRYYEEEIIGKTLRAIISIKNGKAKIKALGHRKQDCFIIINGNNEVMTHQKALSKLLQ